jgi:hypothetical protein
MVAIPGRIKLSRAKDYNMQAASRTVNGLPCISIKRHGGRRFPDGGKTQMAAAARAAERVDMNLRNSFGTDRRHLGMDHVPLFAFCRNTEQWFVSRHIPDPLKVAKEFLGRRWGDNGDNSDAAPPEDSDVTFPGSDGQVVFDGFKSLRPIFSPCLVNYDEPDAMVLRQMLQPSRNRVGLNTPADFSGREKAILLWISNPDLLAEPAPVAAAHRRIDNRSNETRCYTKDERGRQRHSLIGLCQTGGLGMNLLPQTSSSCAGLAALDFFFAGLSVDPPLISPLGSAFLCSAASSIPLSTACSTDFFGTPLCVAFLTAFSIFFTAFFFPPFFFAIIKFLQWRASAFQYGIVQARILSVVAASSPSRNALPIASSAFRTKTREGRLTRHRFPLRGAVNNEGEFR